MKPLRAFIPAQLDDAGLKPPLFRIFCHVSRRAGTKGDSWGSVPNMAKACKLHRETTRSGLQKLEALKMIQRVNRPGRTSLFRPTDMAIWLPLGNEGRPSNHRGDPSGTEVAHPSETKVDKGYPVEGAATAAPATGCTDMQVKTVNVGNEPCGIGALPPAGARAAPIPDQSWLPDQLTVLDLRWVQLAVPDMADFELWQIAEVYRKHALRKRAYGKDIKEARKQRPDLEPWKWFSEEVQIRTEWKAMVSEWQKSNASTVLRSERLARCNAAQPNNPEPRADDIDWQRVLYELTTGHLPEKDFIMYSHELKVLPWHTWEAIPPSMRALLCGNYRAGNIAVNQSKGLKR